MAVTSVLEEWRGEGAAWTATGEAGGFSGTITRSWNVTLDAGTHSAEISLHSSIPQPREGHPYNPYYRAGALSIDRQSPIFAKVSCTYEANNATDGNPLNEPPNITYSSIIAEGEVDEDINGFPIQTVNGEPIPGIKKPFVDLSVSIQRNLLLFNPVSIYTYANTVNNAAFLGFPAGTARLVNVSSSNVIDDDLAYWDVSIEVQFRKPIQTTNDRAWWKRVVHQGFQAKSPLTGKIRHALDEHGNNVAKPVMLTETGFAQDPETGQGYWLEWEIFERSDFNELGMI